MLKRISKDWLVKLAIFIILLTVSYQFLYPFIRMLSLSMMSSQDIINPSVEWVPRNISFQNIIVAANVLRMPTPLINSLWYSGLLALCQTVVSAFTGYAFARLEFKFKNFWFMMMLVSFIIPVPVVLIPRVMMFVSAQDLLQIQLIGTPIPQIIMSLLGQGVYSSILILIFHSFLKNIPAVLDEAAAIDGANPFQIFYHVAIRLSMSTVLVVFLFSLVWNWNETYITSTFLRGKIQLLPSSLSLFESQFTSMASAGALAIRTGEARINEAYKMSATLISILPLMAMYAFVQRKFIEGIENTGITGE